MIELILKIQSIEMLGFISRVSEIMYVMVRMNSLWFFQSKKSINRNNNSQRETNANPTSYQKIPPSATYLIFQNYNINF